ncbi:hypothetical protein QTP70_002585 [Hemibagrus guttatus]|uniref:Uncharacterized protein n=1 Tax=Hemibagrus guttatus TaxID=175788 RepID=A0AAE0QX98_9TELE|nr:hypothetical protein QTP70_002585 [Hemibagrus guttatus]
MPAGREDEMCGKALELLSELCSRGEVHSDKCADFIYSFRDLGRPDYSDSGLKVKVFTEAVVGFVGKLADDTVQKTIIRTFPNQKLWVDKTIRDALRSHATAYNVGLASGDMDSYKAASYNVRKSVKEAKQCYRRKLQSHMSNVYASLADELNIFYACFEAAAIDATANANAIANAKANDSGCRQEENANTKNAFIISKHDVRRAFRRVNTRKAAGPDGESSEPALTS